MIKYLGIDCTNDGRPVGPEQRKSDQHQAKRAFQLIAFLTVNDRQAKTPAARPEQRNTRWRQHIGKNMAKVANDHGMKGISRDNPVVGEMGT